MKHVNLGKYDAKNEAFWAVVGSFDDEIRARIMRQTYHARVESILFLGRNQLAATMMSALWRVI